MGKAKSEYYDIEIPSFDIFNKEQNQRYMLYQMLERTIQMFDYKGLPEGITNYMIERVTQPCGYSIWTTACTGTLHPLRGGLAGPPDIDYQPTRAIIANPALNKSYDLEIDKECVILRNDTYRQGITPLLMRYITIMSEAEISLTIGLINQRMQYLISCENDIQRESADKFITDLIKGKISAVVGKGLMNGIATLPYGSNGASLQPTIEAIQYLKGSMYNELGLDALFNMKREALNSSENQLGGSTLVPLIMNMLDCRKQDIEKINAMYGTSISVDFSPVWETIVEKATTIEEPEEEAPQQDEKKEETTDDNPGSES